MEIGVATICPHVLPPSPSLQANVPIAIATNSNLFTVNLKRPPNETMMARFDHIVCRNSPGVNAPKPAPDTYLIAANALNIKAANCLAFEVSPHALHECRDFYGVRCCETATKRCVVWSLRVLLCDGDLSVGNTTGLGLSGWCTCGKGSWNASRGDRTRSSAIPCAWS